MSARRVVLMLACAAPLCLVAVPGPAVAQTAAAPSAPASSAAAPAGAPSAPTLQAAKDLVAVINSSTLEQMAAQMTSQVWPRIEHSLEAKNASISPAVLAELRTEFIRIQLDFLNKVMGDAPIVYARHFTEPELRELLAFYRSPVGQKALHELPHIMAETMAIVMPRLPQVQAEVAEAFAKALHARGINL